MVGGGGGSEKTPRVSEETVVLHQWGSETQNFRFINRVDKVNWPT